MFKDHQDSVLRDYEILRQEGPTHRASATVWALHDITHKDTRETALAFESRVQHNYRQLTKGSLGSSSTWDYLIGLQGQREMGETLF